MDRAGLTAGRLAGVADRLAGVAEQLEGRDRQGDQARGQEGRA